MQAILALMLLRLPPCICFAGAVYLIAIGVTSGWGWLILVGVVCGGGEYTFKSDDKKDKDNAKK